MFCEQVLMYHNYNQNMWKMLIFHLNSLCICYQNHNTHPLMLFYGAFKRIN